MLNVLNILNMLNVLNILNILNILTVLNILNVLNMRSFPTEYCAQHVTSHFVRLQHKVYWSNLAHHSKMSLQFEKRKGRVV